MVGEDLPQEGAPGQSLRRVSVEGELVTLEGAGVSIRFPARWARKLLAWADGPGRNILCNADARRFNLMGVTRGPGVLILSYVDEEGELRAERASPGFLPILARLLETG